MLLLLLSSVSSFFLDRLSTGRRLRSFPAASCCVRALFVVYRDATISDEPIAMFDPALCGFSSSSSSSSAPCAITLATKHRCDYQHGSPSKRPCPTWSSPCDARADTARVSVYPSDESVPQTLPLFTLPDGFAMAEHNQTQMRGGDVFDVVPTLRLPTDDSVVVETPDPRREKCMKYRNPRFPLAGLMREQGGVYAFMDLHRKNA